jgi:hypothetical protein
MYCPAQQRPGHPGTTGINQGHGRRLQIRNNHRQIIGYIEHDGTVTNTHRQKVGTLNW